MTEEIGTDFENDEDFDSLKMESVETDAVGTYLRSWIEKNTADWARVVAAYVCGTPTVKLAQRVKELASKRYCRMKDVSKESDLEYLVQLMDTNSVVLGLNIHLLIHVEVVDQATLEAVCPSGDSLQGRIFG
jgi:hypothetical protein